jgi:phosphoribosylaminoimidazolecarboxamide formyltransferase/IMP cyclohydrolase
VSQSKKGILDAYKNAYACDRTSAFGGIVGLNRTVNKDLAEELKKIFLEAIIAPGFDEDALKMLSEKKNLRLISIGGMANKEHCPIEFDIKRVCGGALVQTPDTESASELKTVTKRGPTEDELSDLIFAWTVCKHVKSNAIILAKDASTIGIGAGQMSRIDSTRISVMKAADAGIEVPGAVLASDAFFPFSDNVALAARHGITAIIQPGGSIKDQEVIKAADDNDIAMVFTGIRHFRH